MGRLQAVRVRTTPERFPFLREAIQQALLPARQLYEERRLIRP